MGNREDFLEAKKDLPTRLIEKLELEYTYKDHTYSDGWIRVCAFQFKRDPYNQAIMKFPEKKDLILEVVDGCLRDRPIDTLRYLKS